MAKETGRATNFPFFMNSHIASLQVIGELSHSGLEINLPPFFREIVQKGDITDYEKLQDFIFQELQSGSIQVENSAKYIDFLGRQLLLLQFCRRDKKLLDTIETLSHRVQSAKTASQAFLPTEIWESFLLVVKAAYLRITRNDTLESFEDIISNIPWSAFQEEDGWVSLISGMLGLTYIQEDLPDQISKSRIWLDQGIKTGSVSRTLVFRVALANFYQKTQAPNQAQKLADFIEEFRDELKEDGLEFPNKTVKHLYHLASLELESGLIRHSFGQGSDSFSKFERNHDRILQFDTQCRSIDSMPSCSVATLEANLAELYAALYDHTEDLLEKDAFSDRSQKYFSRAVEATESVNDLVGSLDIRYRKARMGFNTKANVTEKEMKEIVSGYKKSQDYLRYSHSVSLFLSVLSRSKSWQKVFDLIIDLFKFGNKQQDENGFYLTLAAMEQANTIFGAETTKPGVSWMVPMLADYFTFVSSTVKDLENEKTMTKVGKSQFDRFRALFSGFEPVSHFNILVYYRYQFQSIKVLKLSLQKNQDTLGLAVANRLIQELNDENNPLSLIKADWPDFKDVPNSVRNKTINLCINISKGDLPLAADHLQFSYRNLRSYITFKEVNRLGFFLDKQETTNRQLELGIRHLFHDLYRQGTIFEVVFDMPKFLVEHAQSGFYSLDLEEALDIKGTTAKKYIKIMMNIDMIRQERSSGRKHFYRLQRENVMKRLGKDQTTLIG